MDTFRWGFHANPQRTEDDVNLWTVSIENKNEDYTLLKESLVEYRSDIKGSVEKIVE